MQCFGALSVCRPSPADLAVDFALSRLVLYRVIRLFGFLIVVTSLRRSGVLSVCHLPLAAVAVEFALGCLVLLSNCRSCIRFALLSCRVIRSFCHRCFVATFRHYICVNVS